MLKRVLPVVFVLLIAIAMLPVYVNAQEDEAPMRTGLRPDAPPYGMRGPHAVGFMEFSDGAEDRPMEGGIWYPAINMDGSEESVTYDLGIGDLLPPANALPGRAILDGEPDEANGPYPLVISSHGMSGDVYFSSYLHEHLASYGFVVMAMYHPGNTFRDSILIGTEEQQVAFVQSAIDSLVLRALDVSQTLDYAEVLAKPAGAMSGMIDMDRVAALGVSYGGSTAVIAGGARIDFRPMAEFCASGVYASMLSTAICQMHGSDLPSLESHLLELAGVNSAPGQLWPSLGDERIDAIVALAPAGGTVLVSEEGYADIQLPMLLVRSGNDQAAIPVYNVDKVWQSSFGASKSLVTLEHAGHMVYNQCPPAAAAIPAFFPSCSDSVWDVNRAHDLIDHFVASFMLAELYGDEDAAAALSPDTAQFPGITYETTEF